MVFKVLEVRRGSRPFWDGYGNGRGSVPGIERWKESEWIKSIFWPFLPTGKIQAYFNNL